MDDRVRIWERLQGESGDLREAYHAAFLREAHRCWSGEIACITRAGLIRQLGDADDAPTHAHDQLIAWLEAGNSDTLPDHARRGGDFHPRREPQTCGQSVCRPASWSSTSATASEANG
jgi:hypothetical protein